MESTPDILLRACYYPAFTDDTAQQLYRQQAAWHLAPLGNTADIIFPQTEAEAMAAAKTADTIFFWQKEAFWAAKAAHRRKGLVVDEYGQQAVGDRLDAFVAQYVTPDYTGHRDAFFEAVKARRPDLKRAIIIGSGPDMSALEKLTAKDRDTSLALYLSTSVLNAQACAACPPDIIIAVDGPSQFGLSETGHRYRARAAELMRRHDSLMLVPAQHLPSIRAHWPEDLQNQIYAVPLTRKVPHGHAFSRDWHYEPTSNVLTSFGLPCAASFAQDIQFAGVSLQPGSQSLKTDTQHWEHVDEALYQRHVAPMLARHPAAGQDNAGYLDRHHARLAQELTAYGTDGLTFAQLGEPPLTISASKMTVAAPQVSPFKVRFYEAIAKAENYPGLILIASFILFGLLGMTLQYTIGKDMMGFFIAGGLAVLFIAGVLFLRLRQNRLAARLESKLSQQQAQQFANLSERLEALERKK